MKKPLIIYYHSTDGKPASVLKPTCSLHLLLGIGLIWPPRIMFQPGGWQQVPRGVVVSSVIDRTTTLNCYPKDPSFPYIIYVYVGSENQKNTLLQ